MNKKSKPMATIRGDALRLKQAVHRDPVMRGMFGAIGRMDLWKKIDDGYVRALKRAKFSDADPYGA